MTSRELEDLLRQLTPQVLGALVRRFGHFDIAGDAVQEALLAAALVSTVLVFAILALDLAGFR